MKITEQQLKKYVKEAPPIMGDLRVTIICPICLEKSKAYWPYNSFVDKHHHLIRRYFTKRVSASHYRQWLKQYYEDRERLTK